jgi:uncharacterized protein YndB with AHSA1/START domain
MSETSVNHATFVLERSFPASPDKVFAAFADPARKRRWFVEERGMQIEDMRMDFRVGGHDRTAFRFGEGSPFPGQVMVNNTVYQEITPGRRIVFAYTMGFGEKPFSASLTTVEISPKGSGTELTFTEQAAFFENADGAKMREEGWTTLLERLGQELAA